MDTDAHQSAQGVADDRILRLSKGHLEEEKRTAKNGYALKKVIGQHLEMLIRQTMEMLNTLKD